MKRLRMPQHADTDVQIKSPAVLTPRRSRMFSHDPFIINTQKLNKKTSQKKAEDAM
jgi:hypothetical protein